jgi:hypothetical protein
VPSGIKDKEKMKILLLLLVIPWNCYAHKNYGSVEVVPMPTSGTKTIETQDGIEIIYE